MPYEGEYASKIAHADIVNDPEVRDFLSRCIQLTEPSEAEGMQRSSGFVAPPEDEGEKPDFVMSIDGSVYEATAGSEQLFPSTMLGYIKIGSFLIKLSEYTQLRSSDSRFVNPDEIARFEEQNEAFIFVLPDSNVILDQEGVDSGLDSFRHELDAQLYGPKTRFDPNDSSTSLRSTLFYLASQRDDEFGTNEISRLRLHKCPVCTATDIEVSDSPEQQKCPNCRKNVYPSDCLRLWEEFDEFQPNLKVMTRLMNVIESLLLIHFIRRIAQLDFRSLARIAFFRDGPLAIYGTAAWLHAPILKTLYDINERLESRGFNKLTILGLLKSGYIVDNASLLDTHIEPGTLFCVNDEYRYTYLKKGRETNNTIGFGAETNFGQDFIYKTPSGKIYVFALPYPARTKSSIRDFASWKSDMGVYEQLPQALSLIRTFESDSFSNSSVPIILAHKFTSISLSPGGRILDILTEELLGRS